ncbi:hypothetical protein DSO57_1016933 [Entomophthora muscae]|uniref:Uncharacterized protein n=1 Tax=Entomophthora muscae TaxID=34485 RepID=A0ACC2TFU7_9FUNG|nr:hypothetical protein DSO57_1016933 [Entomophthora muscae]
MGQGSNPEPNSLQPASSEGQELGCLQPINSNANPPGSEFLPILQIFSSNTLVPANRSFPKVATCGTGSLGSETSNPTNKKSPEPAPGLSLDTCPAALLNTIATNYHPLVSNARSFTEIPTHDIGVSGSKISQSTNENCFKLTQSPGNGAGLEYLPKTNYQVVEQKGSKVYYIGAVNGNPPMPDSTPRIPTPACTSPINLTRQ